MPNFNTKPIAELHSLKQVPCASQSQHFFTLKTKTVVFDLEFKIYNPLILGYSALVNSISKKIIYFLSAMQPEIVHKGLCTLRKKINEVFSELGGALSSIYIKKISFKFLFQIAVHHEYFSKFERTISL